MVEKKTKQHDNRSVKKTRRSDKKHKLLEVQEEAGAEEAVELLVAEVAEEVALLAVGERPLHRFTADVDGNAWMVRDQY